MSALGLEAWLSAKLAQGDKPHSVVTAFVKALLMKQYVCSKDAPQKSFVMEAKSLSYSAV